MILVVMSTSEFHISWPSKYYRDEERQKLSLKKKTGAKANKHANTLSGYL